MSRSGCNVCYCLARVLCNQKRVLQRHTKMTVNIQTTTYFELPKPHEVANQNSFWLEGCYWEKNCPTEINSQPDSITYSIWSSCQYPQVLALHTNTSECCAGVDSMGLVPCQTCGRTGHAIGQVTEWCTNIINKNLLCCFRAGKIHGSRWPRCWFRIYCILSWGIRAVFR